MGQKVNPNAIRLNITKKSLDCWYADGKNYADYIYTHMQVRKFLKKKLFNAGINCIEIERLSKTAQVIIHASRPGVIIGKKGSDVDALRVEVSRLMGLSAHVVIKEIRKPDLESTLVAENIAGQLERRVMFRRAMRRAVQNTLRAGAKGVRICVSGRLGGAEIASSKTYLEGRVPLHTFRADINYGVAEAHTTYGIIGIKVWIFKGEVIKKAVSKDDTEGR